ncbi:MAG TPA: protease complex subunit PrcB family protein [Desulfurivibrio alkaliphilus]|uniref:Protease complex subunit PrcB family protein n=1 Tax=Desulfurivibrio alkaliphilus TaxID=427923 RepID=A0A7C2TH48_9BACT|nr:protease complex subunit PrcB family protein [Desulfurivibrio alkaliphilus]
MLARESVKHGLVILVGLMWLLLSLSGCVADDDDDGGEESGDRVAFSLLRSGQASGVDDERLTVMREQAAFADLWQEHAAAFSPPPIQPEVDFSQDMVVAVFLGRRATGGHSLTVTEIRERSASFLVKLRATLPEEGCTVSDNPSQPYQMVVVPRSTKVVAFSFEVQVGCP